MWLRGHRPKRTTNQDRQAGYRVGTVVTTLPPVGCWARVGLVKRVRGALVRRQVAKAVASLPAGAVLILGIAIGVALGAAMVLSVLINAARESQ